MLGRMSARELSIDIGSFTATSVVEAEGVHVVLSGECDLAALDPLDALLRALHDELVERQAHEVSIDLRAVDFMNSSCLTKVIQWITRMRVLPLASQYRIRFKANPRAPWQKRSLEALRCLATERISIEL